MLPKADTQPCNFLIENMALSISYLLGNYVRGQVRACSAGTSQSLFGGVKVESKVIMYFILIII